MIRVCIADDHRLIRTGVRAALEAAGFEVAGEASSGDQVVAMVDEHEPDLLLLDLRMPGADGLSCVAQVKARHPAVRIIMLSASENPDDIAAALAAGASAYVGKRIAPADLGSALRQVVEGTVPHRALEAASPDGDAIALTERESTILEALGRGLSTKAISRELWISETTVKFHLTNVYRKLGVHNRASAMRYAYEHGLISSDRTSRAEAAPSSG